MYVSILSSVILGLMSSEGSRGYHSSKWEWVANLSLNYSLFIFHSLVCVCDEEERCTSSVKSSPLDLSGCAIEQN